MAKETLFDKIQVSLFSDDSSALEKLSEHDLVIRKRFMAAFTVWLENPTYTDKQLVNFLMREFSIETSQAYRDISKLRVMLGNVRNAGKEWHRYTIIEMCKETYNMAKKKGDPKAMSMATDKLGKYTRCDQLEAEEMPWGSIIPPDLETSTDPTILGFVADPEAEKKRLKMRKKYSRDIEDAVLVETV